MLRLGELHKRYGDTVAVNGLSLEVEAGEIVGLLGPNGAGKSTTVHMIVGFLAPDSGTIEIDGRGAPDAAAIRRLIGVAPQTLSLYEDLTAEENLRFFASIYGLTGAARALRVDAVLDAVGLADRRGDRVKTYSGGMKRRLNIATALVHEPALLVLDEPTAGVDPQSRNAILETTERLREGGTTIIYTTHYMEEAQRVCDRVAVVDHGAVLALDTVDALIAEHGGASTLVVDLDGETRRIESDHPLAELNRLASETTLSAFHIERPTLEEVFLHLTGRSLRD